MCFTLIFVVVNRWAFVFFGGGRRVVVVGIVTFRGTSSRVVDRFVRAILNSKMAPRELDNRIFKEARESSDESDA